MRLMGLLRGGFEKDPLELVAFLLDADDAEVSVDQMRDDLGDLAVVTDEADLHHRADDLDVEDPRTTGEGLGGRLRVAEDAQAAAQAILP